MHPRWAVFYIALAWDNLFFGDGNKFDYYLKQAEEKDDSKLVEYLENKLKEIEAKRNDKLCSLTLTQYSPQPDPITRLPPD